MDGDLIAPMIFLFAACALLALVAIGLLVWVPIDWVKTRGRLVLALALVALALPALAQQPKQQQIDPRLAAPMVNAAKAEMTLLEAAVRALQEDMQQLDARWAEYSKPLWQMPQAAPAVPPAPRE